MDGSLDRLIELFIVKTMACAWSHKSAAAIAGLGSFGLHRMLITDAGCAGRCGSLLGPAV